MLNITNYLYSPICSKASGCVVTTCSLSITYVFLFLQNYFYHIKCQGC